MLDGLYIRIIAALCLAIGIASGGLYYGHTRYKAGVKATRVSWDADRATWQAALDKQKHDALQLIIIAQAQADAIAKSNQRLHDQQEKDYAAHQQETGALRAQLATRSLRYAAVTPSAGRGSGSCGSVPCAAPAAEPPARTVVQLPDSLAGNLRQFAADADDLTDAYRRCVQAVSGGPSL
jgi:hypothetical protein